MAFIVPPRTFHSLKIMVLEQLYICNLDFTKLLEQLLEDDKNKMSVTDKSKQGNQYIYQLFAIIHDHINPALVDVLHNDGANPDTTYKGIPRDPKLLYLYLSKPQSRSLIQRLRQRRIITQYHFDLLFPPECVETDSQKFDLILNKVMIIYFTTLKPASGTWKIYAMSDTSIAANVIRAIDFRNFIYHYPQPAHMTTQEFDIKFTEAENVSTGLRYKGNINSAKAPTATSHKGRKDRLKNVEEQDVLTASKSCI